MTWCYINNAVKRLIHQNGRFTVIELKQLIMTDEAHSDVRVRIRSLDLLVIDEISMVYEYIYHIRDVRQYICTLLYYVYIL